MLDERLSCYGRWREILQYLLDMIERVIELRSRIRRGIPISKTERKSNKACENPISWKCGDGKMLQRNYFQNVCRRHNARALGDGKRPCRSESKWIFERRQPNININSHASADQPVSLTVRQFHAIYLLDKQPSTGGSSVASSRRLALSAGVTQWIWTRLGRACFALGSSGPGTDKSAGGGWEETKVLLVQVHRVVGAIFE